MTEAFDAGSAARHELEFYLEMAPRAATTCIQVSADGLAQCSEWANLARPLATRGVVDGMQTTGEISQEALQDHFGGERARLGDAYHFYSHLGTPPHACAVDAQLASYELAILFFAGILTLGLHGSARL